MLGIGMKICGRHYSPQHLCNFKRRGAIYSANGNWMLTFW